MKSCYIYECIMERIFGKRFLDQLWPYFLMSFFIIWLPLNVLNYIDRVILQTTEIHYLNDFAAYAQYIFAIPLFFYARRVLDYQWETVHATLVDAKIMGDNVENINSYYLYTLKSLTSRKLKRWIVVVTILLSLNWLYTEMTSPTITYHAFQSTLTQRFEVPTTAGLYLCLVSNVIYLSLFFYMSVYYLMWVYYMYLVVKNKPVIIPHHSDRSGGLNFMSLPIRAFGILIFCISVVQVTIAFYKINIEGADLLSAHVLMQPLLFVLLAPFFFVLPFFLFTKQLYMAKVKGIKELTELSYRIRHLRTTVTKTKGLQDDLDYFGSLNDLAGHYENVNRMRIWPLDLGSLAQIFGSAFVPIIPILVKIIPVPKQVSEIFNLFF